jgi:hypothetical protein
MNLIEVKMKFVILTTTILILFLSGCASVNLNYLPHSETYYSPTTSIKVFSQAPDIPYVLLGMITAETTDMKKEEMLARLKKKAMLIGADGLIMGAFSKTIKQGGYYRPSNVRSRGYLYSIEERRIKTTAIRFTDSQ